jgi:hypothetical protein
MSAVKRLVVAGLAIVVAWAAGLPPVAARQAPSTGSAQGPAKASAQPSKPAPPAEELDKLLAPIALYPDALLGQMLLCATNPGRVGALAEWLSSQQAKGTALQDAAKASGFDESFVALVVFPDVVLKMAEQMDWTTRVGQAFMANQSAVFGSIQRLRTKARDAGKLKDTAQQDVETRTTSSGQQVIVIEPTNPQIVYVPQYNPQTVYTTSTVVVQDTDNTSEAVAAGLIGFTAGIAIGAAIDNDYYYGPYGWRGGFYMYDDAWDDWYDHREDAREDWMDHREDIMEDRGDVARNAQEQRTERAQTRQENRPESQAQRDERQQSRQTPEAQAQREQRRTEAQGAATQASGTARTTAESRGYSRDSAKSGAERSGTKSDAFSGYSSGKSTRSASSRGQKSRSSSRGGRR